MTPITPSPGKRGCFFQVTRTLCALVFPTLMAVPATALDLPAGAVKTNEITLSPAEFARTRFDGERVPLITLPGEMRVEAWQIVGNEQTNYQLLKPLTDQLIAEGYQMIFRCQAVSCGGYDFRFEVGKLTAPDLFVDLSRFQYVTARKGDDLVGILVSHGGADGFIQISRRVNESTPTTITAPAASTGSNTALGSALLEQGHIVLTEVTFATGSATLDASADAQLAELARFLGDTPDARLALVGHTDAQGSLENNIALSRKRAGAVRSRLIKTYGIAASRLQADGVGYLSPLTTNRSAEGRDANRRVEAVLLNTE